MNETKRNVLETNVEAFVNAVNCVGVMGKGIASQFKQTFSAAYFKAYKTPCRNGELTIGKVQIFELENVQTNQRFIVNFPTKINGAKKAKSNILK